MTFKHTSKAVESVRIDGLSSIATNYDLILCDVWGVLHNGISARPDCIDALSNFRKNAGTVIMITNAPRQRKAVKQQLKSLGVPASVYDEIVTSGDVTRDLMKNGEKKLFHIGPDKDLNLFEGLDVERVDEENAKAVICSGLWNEKTETPADYTDLLQRLQKRDLTLICANPDLVVEVGDHLEYCAGAIAQAYRKLGGNTLISGKPYEPIYKLAVSEAQKNTGTNFDKSKILAIGDGMPTDIKGADSFGIDALYISAGIHSREYGDIENPDHESVQQFLKQNDQMPIAYLPRLRW